MERTVTHYDCCEHCEPGDLCGHLTGPPHNIPCPEGCNDAEVTG